MNSSVGLRFLFKTSKLSTNGRNLQLPRVIKPLGLNAMSTKATILPSKERESFQDTFPFLMQSLVNNSRFSQVPEVANWVQKVIDYVTAGGKKNRGMTTVVSYELLEKPENITEDSLRLARILGWCTEILQGFFILADDVMDGSTTRRGILCWYRLPNVGLGAINDGILVHMSIYEILRMHFKNMPQYTDLVDLFNESILLTSAGQHLDFTTAANKDHEYSLYTIDRYNSIVLHKTAYYTIRLPIKLGMILANITDKATLEKADKISLEIGQLFQMQDDYIDCYSDEATSGKAGTDIQEGKCTWFAVMALQLSNQSQRALFKQYYGSKDPEHVQNIKKLYEELKLAELYCEKERTLYENILRRAQEFAQETGHSSDVFLKVINNLYKRKQ